MDQISRPFLTFLSVAEKNWLLFVESLFWQLGTQFSSCCHYRQMAILLRGFNESQCMNFPPQKSVAIVERWPSLRGLNESQCMNCQPQNSGRCREVADSRGSTIAYLTCNGPLLPTIWTVFTQLFLSTSMACSHMSVFWIIRKQKIKELYDDNLNRHG